MDWVSGFGPEFYDGLMTVSEGVGWEVEVMIMIRGRDRRVTGRIS